MENHLGGFGERSQGLDSSVGQMKHLFIYLRTSFTNHTHLEHALSTQAKSAKTWSKALLLMAAGTHAGPANS